ncbi:uroporphyrinogen-III C-methyltransferase [Pseudobacillus wudalianchiensis]|uniref:Uroporphyrinogen-III C-methyltransferase n=1 Tax=Pseudobacillus wudalianchiensis TaxID=1743143 RepID=A0A1B9ADW5_9BACI|nr:uroporphyrinogen-III C-methyltransferase [Bacillus wudalianchiensis]OCA82025.1 uroporphyrinogen-III C-methyltransferase [Bacillus wudalianchiensis]
MAKVWLVGAGPGDPDLITVKGLKAIKGADVILYDRLISPELLEYAKPEAELIFCGKLPDHHHLQQETINYLLVKHAKKGKNVVRLKGGDPFVFGRGGEEAAFLVEHGVSFEVIPGITSGIAAPAYAGIPVTHREHSASFAIVTGHRREGEKEELKWSALANGIDTLAIYMGVKNLPYIQEKLISHGKSPETPVALIHWGTTKEQRTVTGTLETIVDIVKAEGITNPSMIVVGEVVRLREQLQWFGDWETDAVLAAGAGQ